jgi:ABC-type hemin transport system substrate-binding protein
MTLVLKTGSSLLLFFCDYPRRVKDKPKIGGFANPSLEAIIAARPDLVLMMEGENPMEAFNRVKKMGIKTYVFHAKGLRELPQGIRELGRVLGIEATEPTGERPKLKHNSTNMQKMFDNPRPAVCP